MRLYIMTAMSAHPCPVPRRVGIVHKVTSAEATETALFVGQFLKNKGLEVLVDEAARLAERAKAQGVETTLELYDERLHIFSLFPFLPNAARALASIGAFVARRAGARRAAE